MNLKVKALAFASVFVLMQMLASAQEAKRMSIEEALELGIANSKNLKIDDAKIVEATAAIDEAKNKQLPDLKISGSYLRLTNANVNLRTAQSSSEGGAQQELPQR
ncbi:TolC family protein [Niabella ginsengisoli]|uniref:TolC family protein n=1 Tax=Niabella ginsengisoli TaxID=522298 RepID=UPI0021D43C4B|nr:TolC family protein [Niabella ginsengisoli]